MRQSLPSYGPSVLSEVLDTDRRHHTPNSPPEPCRKRLGGLVGTGKARVTHQAATALWVVLRVAGLDGDRILAVVLAQHHDKATRVTAEKRCKLIDTTHVRGSADNTHPHHQPSRRITPPLH